MLILIFKLDTFEPAMYRVANNTECLVIYIEYRLIPEFKYPVIFWKFFV